MKRTRLERYLKAVHELERPFKMLYHSSMSKRVVSYVRVSTQRQGQSNLGIEAQRAAVEEFCRQNGCELIAEYREVESGRKSDRPVLREALAEAKATKAVLLIAKLDRLARNVHFISGLMESGVEFRACDMPHANKLTLHILSAVAEAEADAISTRTKDALAAAKRRGKRLGAANPKCRNLTDEAVQKGAIASGKRTSALAREENAKAATVIRELQAQDMSLRAIAAELNRRGVKTRAKGQWSHVQVARILDY